MEKGIDQLNVTTVFKIYGSILKVTQYKNSLEHIFLTTLRVLNICS